MINKQERASGHRETPRNNISKEKKTFLFAHGVIFNCICLCQGYKTIHACHENTCVQEREIIKPAVGFPLKGSINLTNHIHASSRQHVCQNNSSRMLNQADEMSP